MDNEVYILKTKLKCVYIIAKLQQLGYGVYNVDENSELCQYYKSQVLHKTM